MRSFVMTLFCLLILSQCSFCQQTSGERGLPITIEYLGAPAVVISMDQVDSVNLTYDYLDECNEYTDSLESTIGGLNAVVDSGKVAEGLLKTSLGLEEKINSVNSEIIKELNSDNKSLKRKLKLNKFVVKVLGGITAILLLFLLLPIA